MQIYNKVMLYFWLVAALLNTIVVTYMGFTDGWEVWAYYYIGSLMCLLFFFTRRFMMKRMEKHMQFLKEQEENREADQSSK